VTDPFKNKNGNTVISVTSPVFKDGEFAGVMAVDLDGEAITKIADKLKLGTGYSFILSKNGMFIAHPDRSLVMKVNATDMKSQMGEMAKDMVTGHSGSRDIDYNGQSQTVFYSPLNQSPWSIAVVAIKSEFFAPLNRLVNFIIICGILAIVLLLVSNFASIQRAISPIVSIKNQLAEIADGDGDLTREIVVTSKDEVADLANAFNRFIQTLRYLIINISKSAETVAASSQELSSSTEQASQVTQQIATTINQIAIGAQNQVASVDAAKSAVDIVTRAVADDMSVIENVSEAAQMGTENAAEGSTATGQVDECITDLQESAKIVNSTIQSLSVKSDDIQSVVELISTIADQTNLLALNAAIESARAGEHGRGFAVVSEEIRKLAEKSGQSTKEISKLIADIRKEINIAVEATQRSYSAVEMTADRSKIAGDSLSKISGSSSTILSNVLQLVESSKSINDAINTVGSTMETMASVTEETSASSEEVSASTEEQSAALEEITASSRALADMAQQLMGLVARFKV
jgi:methyl-accepting chemotaxis protein